MDIDKLNEGLKQLSSVGLNLFSSIKVTELPEDILTLLKEQKVVYDNSDTLCLVAHGGKTLWENLPHPINEQDHPIDTFSINQMKWFGKVILDEEVRILFPHNQFTIPLQRIGRFMNLSRPSLLGLDINNQYGVWFAFRGAFLTKKNIPLEKGIEFDSPCDTCADKPCRNICPANALEGMLKFNINLCASHRLSENSSCSDRCLSRIACPYKSEHQYEIKQIQYHMTRIHHIKKLSSFL